MNAQQLNLLCPGILEALKTQVLPTYRPAAYRADKMPCLFRRTFRVCWYGSAGSDRRVVDLFGSPQSIVGFSPAVYFFTDTCFFEHFDYAEMQLVPRLCDCYCVTVEGNRPVRAYIFPGGELGLDIGTSDESFEASVIHLGLQIDIACHAGGMAGPGPQRLASLKTQYSLGRTPKWSGAVRRCEDIGEKPFGTQIVREVQWGLSHVPYEMSELRRVVIPRPNEFERVSDAIAAFFHLPSCGQRLDLSLLTELSPSAARRFAATELSLHLDKLPHLDEATAAELKKTLHALDLSGLCSLDKDPARHLSEMEAALYLDGLREIPPSIAEILSQKAGFLSLGGLQELTPEMAAIFMRHKGTLALNGVRIISNAAVKLMATHEGQIQLRALTRIEDLNGIQLERIPSLLLGTSWSGDVSKDAAVVFAKLDNTHLDLKCSVQPSDDVLRLLASFNGSIRFGPAVVATNSVVSILAQGPAEVSFETVPSWKHLEEIHARILTSGHWQYRVRLDSVHSLSDAAAARLLKQERQYERTYWLSHWLQSLHILGENQAKFLLRITSDRSRELTFLHLSELSQPIAAILAASNHGLSFPAVQTLGPETAELLASSTGSLSLTGLFGVSPETAAALAKHRGILNLDGLTNLTVEAASGLASHTGTLSLRGINTLSPEAAGELQAHQGPISWHRLDVTHPSVARCLVACRQGPMRLDLIKTLTSETAAVLAGERCELSLNGLTELSDSCALALSEHRGPLRLNGLKGLSAESAAALGRHRGPLYLSGIRTLSAECAVGLSRHTGALYLTGLLHIEYESAAALSSFTGPLYMRDLAEISSECRRVLQAKPNYPPIFR